jgi:hypothetical protein
MCQSGDTEVLNITYMHRMCIQTRYEWVVALGCTFFSFVLSHCRYLCDSLVGRSGRIKSKRPHRQKLYREIMCGTWKKLREVPQPKQREVAGLGLENHGFSFRAFGQFFRVLVLVLGHRAIIERVLY